MSTAASALPRPRSQGKAIFFAVFLTVTVFVTYMKNAQVFDPSSRIAQHFAPVRLFVAVHAFFAALALLLGVFQFSNRLRARYLKVHRVLGYIYVVSVFISVPFSIPVALKIDSLSLTAASVAQGFGWMVTTAIALYCVRNGNVAQHRRWMIRSYPFAMVFTVARLVIPIPPILKMGFTGIEMVVWSAIVLAAFVPSIMLDWPASAPRSATKTAGASR